MRLLFLVLVCTLAVNAAKEKARFDNYRVYNVHVSNKMQMEFFTQLQEYPDGFIFLYGPYGVGKDVKIMVPPHKFGDWSDFDEKYNLKSNLVVKNFQEQLDLEVPSPRPARSTLDWTFYWTLDEVNQWIDEIVARYPGVTQAITIGTSFQGRPIRAIRLNRSGTSNKKAVVVEGTIHAREWISTAFTTYSLNELLTTRDPEVIEVANRYIWYFLPVTNPDGYLFTWTNNRMWRKTRQPSSAVCFGADPNRNFDYRWNQGGSSNNPCSDTFNGPSAFSEPETRQLADFYLSIPNYAAYLSIHSFGQMLLYPPGYTTTPTALQPQLHSIGLRANAAATAQFGFPYILGSITDIFSIVTGNTVDWSAFVARTNLTYAYELRDTGTNHFILPPDQIIPNNIENFASLITIMREGFNLGLA